ncbi:branched-chain amino acid transport system II carrier protein [Clostridium sp. NSJ-6]|uniref:Branched-chain amino acid transport system carrier protein n=1 Tax=Clostridium hominis TaxID=2763036 RepID=A0ABR7DAB0_9CLOT|nr:branched-chain amino acid transport system II carrier protein [Clostridium hominis]MBC5628085.1 branched-chain amino acid transport system II carrier protein [Clostridium hominis]
MKKSTKDSIVIGFALFSMFFGAGNLIFPGFLGNSLGSDFLLGTVGFVVTGVGLPLLAIVACSKGDGTFESIGNRIDRKFILIFTTVLFLAIGPLMAVPRTAATTFELSVNPFLPNVPAIVAITVYFAINLFFVLKKSAIVDTIGKFLTPALLILLIVLIVKGIVSPIGEIVNTNASAVLSTSLIEGYQTMDALGALLFASIVTTSLKDKGYRGKEMPKMIFKSSLVAAIGLAFVYGGLMYIGAQTSGLVSQEIGKTGLLLLISESVFGKVGPAIIGLAMGLACLSTSIGLVSVGASFFEKISKGKLSYNLNAIVITIISLAVATLGVDKIVALSGPVLNLLYPVSITIIVTTLMSKYLKNTKAVRLGIYTSLVFSLLLLIPGLNLSFLPLADLGFGWVVPTVLSIIIGIIIFKEKTTESSLEKAA